ncbi:uncharacterized protein DS421_9g255060 [Arachis hypogaea]|nr:uncharacterized protein DS421_9g255060 [Arachis hypogaea]
MPLQFSFSSSSTHSSLLFHLLFVPYSISISSNTGNGLFSLFRSRFSSINLQVTHIMRRRAAVVPSKLKFFQVYLESLYFRLNTLKLKYGLSISYSNLFCLFNITI